MHPSNIDIEAELESSRRFTQAAFGLLALAALGFGLAVHLAPLPLDPEARSVISWSFIGLASADTALLLVWKRIIDWISNH